MSGLFDTYHRRINYMRISITDRCNMCCIYCTARSVPRLTHDDILRYKEIQRIVKAAVGLGVKSLRITGGEPLVRPDVSALVELLSQVDGITDISLTTNGALLAKYAAELKEAGLKRVNISLDSFKADRFKYITGTDKLGEVLNGIEAAKKVGLDPVKINMVVLKGINDDEVIDFARMSLDEGWHIRYIEYMPFADTEGEGNRVVAVGDILESIQQSLGKMEPCLPTKGNGPAKYYKLHGAEGTVGFIGAVTDCFCANCNRFRLTADGGLRPCLLEDDEVDIKGPLRSGASIEELARLIQEAANMKREHHRLGEEFVRGKRQMWQIGG
ncbi:MAG TPA: GTP 3',8-cyclase MoaA [Dehalococcoidia bacterium]|nr:GTP 3',8-cyclase MoaA [Dehalococcoidia bacterium]